MALANQDLGAFKAVLDAVSDSQAEERMRIVGLANSTVDKFAELERDITRDTRTGRIISPNTYKNDQNNITFTLEAVVHKVKSYEAKRPVYVDMEFITIICPGKANSFTIHSPVEEFHRWQYPEEYKKFQDGLSAQIFGTPLALWPELKPSQIKELEYVGIKTIEQIVGAPDNVGVVNALNLKEKARAFLARTADVAAVGQVDQKLADQDAAHKAEIAALTARMNDLMALVQNKAQQLPDTDEPKVERKRYGKKKTEAAV